MKVADTDIKDLNKLNENNEKRGKARLTLIQAEVEEGSWHD